MREKAREGARGEGEGCEGRRGVARRGEGEAGKMWGRCGGGGKGVGGERAEGGATGEEKQRRAAREDAPMHTSEAHSDKPNEEH